MRVSRNLSGVSAVALVAIAATIGASYTEHERASGAIAQSRELARLARAVYATAVERELSLVTHNTGTSSGSANSSTGVAAKLGVMVDSLMNAARKDPDRDGDVSRLSAAYLAWNRAMHRAAQSEATPDQLVRIMKQAPFRDQLSDFIHREDLRYEARQQRQTLVRVLMTGALFAEILVLLLVVNALRKRLYLQASEVLHHKESLESQTATLLKQADKLELTNKELALAISEKENARKFAEDQAAEQATLFSAITEVFFVLDR
jgi:hypothetical protein